MTTLYRPVLIETAEQAEALPVGTVAMWPHGHFAMTAEGRWLSPGRGVQSTAGGLVGYTALVPIEAEEVFQRTYALPASTFPGLGWPEQYDKWERRLVTPWEEA